MHILLQVRILFQLAIIVIGCLFVCTEQMSVASATPCNPGIRPFIIMEMVQGGFAGQTAERTSIGEDGCFTVERLLNGKVIAHLRSGRLGPEQIRSGRSAIDAADFASLPVKIGASAVVNPASFSISYRGVTKTAALMDAADIEEIRALSRKTLQEPAAARLADLFIRLINLTGS